jgi:hypothetical protein
MMLSFFFRFILATEQIQRATLTVINPLRLRIS